MNREKGKRDDQKIRTKPGAKEIRLSAVANCVW